MILPIKLIMPTSISLHDIFNSSSSSSSSSSINSKPLILGLGDIVIPGLVVSFARRIDDRLKFENRGKVDGKRKNELFAYQYFNYTLLGFISGLVMAFTASLYFHLPQPALVYLVPGTLFPIYAIAMCKSQITILTNLDVSNEPSESLSEVNV
jgi:signal peptide peptidase-like protein 3